MNWKNIWDSIVNFFSRNVWSIVLFASVFVFGYIIVKLLLKMVKKLLSKSKMENIAQHFIFIIVKFCLYLIWILVLLNTIGIEVSGILTAFSAIILAVGMALQGNIANLANGIVIVSSKMFKKGDYIIVDGKEGSISEINFLFTTIMTTDNKKITIPNSTIVNSSVVNAGANSSRRVDFMFSVAYETDVELVKKIVIDVMTSNGKVYLDKAPFCRLKFLGASSIDFVANCWCDSEDYWDVYYYVMENVYNEFKRNNISIPYNQLEIRNRVDQVVMPYNTASLPARVEKERAKEQDTSILSTIFRPKKKSTAKSKTKKKEE